jgi:hypothetical protein
MARSPLKMFEPYLGVWVAEAHSPMGKLRCERTLERVLGDKYVSLTALWEFGPGKRYEERALFGVDGEKTLRFWSFTSDGKQSSGTHAEAPDLPEGALAFEARMPAGLARMAYWPTEEGFQFTVESRNKKGWKRFVEHNFRPKKGKKR